MNDVKHVLVVIGKMDRGGAETIIMNLYRNIDHNKVQFDFAVHTKDKADYDDEILALGGRIFRLPLYRVINGFSYRKAWKKFLSDHKGEFVAVHGHIGSCAAIYLKEAKKQGIFTISHSHSCMNGISGLLFKLLTFPQRFFVDYFIGCSKEAGIDRFGKKVVSNPSKYTTLNNGIDAKSYIYNLAIREKYRNEFGVEDKFVVGHIGRFTYAKNHKFLLEIFSEIKKMRNDAVLVLAGRGELEDKIREYVKELGLTNDVIFSGVRSDVSNLLQMYDVFVFPSNYEGLPLSVIEAQASGLPCLISTAVSELACVTDNCEMLTLKLTAKEWAEKVLYAYDNTIRGNKYEDIKNSGFDITEVAKEMEDFYINI